MRGEATRRVRLLVRVLRTLLCWGWGGGELLLLKARRYVSARGPAATPPVPARVRLFPSCLSCVPLVSRRAVVGRWPEASSVLNFLARGAHGARVPPRACPTRACCQLVDRLWCVYALVEGSDRLPGDNRPQLLHWRRLLRWRRGRTATPEAKTNERGTHTHSGTGKTPHKTTRKGIEINPVVIL